MNQSWRWLVDERAGCGVARVDSEELDRGRVQVRVITSSVAERNAVRAPGNYGIVHDTVGIGGQGGNRLGPDAGAGVHIHKREEIAVICNRENAAVVQNQHLATGSYR